MRFELTTPTLARLCSTPELRPLKLPAAWSFPFPRLWPTGWLAVIWRKAIFISRGFCILMTETDELPPDARQLIEFLEEYGIHTRTVTHPPAFTVQDAQALRGRIPGGHTKNLFLKDKKGHLVLVVALEDTQIDLKRLHKRIGVARLSFGKPELLEEVLRVKPGSVTPFALINDREHRVRVILDARMMQYEVLNFHPLVNTATTSIDRDDFLRFLRITGHEPLIIDVQANDDDSEDP